jgi:glutathione synthase/RimK-type ligase-like ATP-grasp enzyme
MKTVTVAREPEYSPNMASDDAAILEAVSRQLQARGAETIQANGDSLPPDTDAVCHMSRSKKRLMRLKELEKQGITVINSTAAVENCSRQPMMQRLQEAGIPQPAFTMIDRQTALESLGYPAWIKRAHGWSCHKNDISYAANASEAAAAVREMSSRGIVAMIHCRHIEGDIIKFYGIGRRFFHYSYPDPEKSKFGLERINGAPHRYPFSLENMKEIVFAAAEALGLEIYGGDGIVGSDGSISVIDMNDFPSFSSVREDAAREIAVYMTEKINNKNI